MAKKKPSKAKPANTRGGKKPKPAKKQATKKRSAKRTKTPASKRKPNRYNQLRRAISQYCYRKYNYRCSNEEINRVYNELKRRYFDVDPKKQIPPSELAKNIDTILGFKDENDVPLDLQTFNWFDVETFLREQDGLFFKQGDKITLDLAEFGGEVVFNIEKLGNVYRDSIYPRIRQGIDEYEQQFGQRPSPPPYFEFDEDASDTKKRKFVWRLELDQGAAILPTTPQPPAGGEQPPKPTAEGEESQDSEKILQLRKEVAEAETERNKSRLALIKEGRELLKEGLITKDEFKTMFLDA